MRRALCIAAVLVAAADAGDPPKPRVTRAELAAVETSFDQRIARLSVADDPMEVLGSTRGVYLEGYGAVFTTEVNLVITPPITPFRMKITKEEVARVHQRKLERLPALKRAMRAMLVSSAASLDDVPANEQVVVGVTLFFLNWEDRTGLPSQIVMQAPRRPLLEYNLGTSTSEALEAAIREQVF